MDIETNTECTVEDRDARPLSPCILICTLDDDKRCLGCGRSLQQITGWARMNKDEQWAVIDELAALPRAIDGTIAPANGG